MVNNTNVNEEERKKFYNDHFYEKNRAALDGGARTIVRLILDIIGQEQINSVVDVGCGAGTMLYSFQENDVKKIIGIDGEWAKTEHQLLNENQFFSEDLRNPRLSFDEKFDIVVSTEVAEHLEIEYAESFIEFLVSLGELVVFSAAIPGQGGTHHVNEQPQSYWQEKFSAKGYLLLDLIRPRIWNNEKIQTHYKQNLFIYVKEDSVKYKEFISKYFPESKNVLMDAIHPETFAYYNDPVHFGVRKSMKGLWYGIINFVNNTTRRR